MSKFQIDQRIAVVAVCTYERPPESMRWLLDSCKRYGIQVQLIGEGQGYDCNYRKLEIIASYLREHPFWRYVLAVDCRDVIFCSGLRELFIKYQAYGRPIVAAAERICYPMHSHRELSPHLGRSQRYLNSGTILATTDAWRRAWEWMRRRKLELASEPVEYGICNMSIFRCDQAAWSDYYLNGPGDVALDIHCEMFQAMACIDGTVAASNRDLIFEGQRVINRETGGRPCVLHANGHVPVAPWGQYVLEPSPAWITPLIERLRTASVESLGDLDFMTRLILELGLDDALSFDDSTDENGAIDDVLLPYTGKGLQIDLQPREFAKYLIWLSKQAPLHSYLEVGSRTPGVFIASLEYLRRFHPLKKAWIFPSGSLRKRLILEDYRQRLAGVQLIASDSELPQEACAADLLFVRESTLAANGERRDGFVNSHEIAQAKNRLMAGPALPMTDQPVVDFTDSTCFRRRGLRLTMMRASTLAQKASR